MILVRVSVNVRHFVFELNQINPLNPNRRMTNKITSWGSGIAYRSKFRNETLYLDAEPNSQ